jgi:hypothetical protein
LTRERGNCSQTFSSLPSPLLGLCHTQQNKCFFFLYCNKKMLFSKSKHISCLFGGLVYTETEKKSKHKNNFMGVIVYLENSKKISLKLLQQF